MIRRRNLWCGVRSSVMCSLPRVHVTHPYRMVSITLAVSMRNFRANGAASISYSSRFATLVPASQMYELYIYIHIYRIHTYSECIRRRTGTAVDTAIIIVYI